MLLPKRGRIQGWRNLVRTSGGEVMLTSDCLNSRSDYKPRRSLLGASVALHLVLAATGAAMAAPPPRPNLAAVQSWAYQLQQIDLDRIAASPHDMVVVDYARSDTPEATFSRSDVAIMQRKPDGTSRLVLAYLSIGEAEDYRPYWRRDWISAPPPWLMDENPDWPGNYAVQYWDPRWQELILGSPGAYLDNIIAAGFDGVYLDRIDAFDIGVPDVSRDRRMQLMAEFVSSIANYARQTQPGFLIIGQNGEELLADPVYAEALDGVGKEDLFFGLHGDGSLNSKSELRASLRPLQRFQKSGKPVFLVEYLIAPDAIALARDNAAAMGALLFIGDRELDDARSR
jgi:cysteinyl-tRNA synthetase